MLADFGRRSVLYEAFDCRAHRRKSLRYTDQLVRRGADGAAAGKGDRAERRAGAREPGAGLITQGDAEPGSHAAGSPNTRVIPRSGGSAVLGADRPVRASGPLVYPGGQGITAMAVPRGQETTGGTGWNRSGGVVFVVVLAGRNGEYRAAGFAHDLIGDAAPDQAGEGRAGSAG